MQTILFKIMFNTANVYSSSLNICTVSKEKVEKVVNAPAIPASNK